MGCGEHRQGNNLVFQGRERILEGELEQGRERSIYQGEKKLREQERDTSKYWKRNSIRIAYIGFENETEPENDMPLRVMGYDGAAYRDQISHEVDENGRRSKVRERYPVYFVQMRKNGTYRGTKKDARHMREVLQLLSVLTDDSRFQTVMEARGKGVNRKT